MLGHSHRRVAFIARRTTGRLQEAEGYFRLALRLFDDLHAEFPDVELYRKFIVDTRTEVGTVLLARGERDQASEAFRQTLAGWEKLVADFPTSPAYRGALGMVRAELGQWKEAAADFAKAVELQEADVRVWYWHALVRLQAGDHAAYRKICAAMLERFGKTDEPNFAWYLAWTCVLGSQEVADQARPVQVAERVVAKDPNNTAYRTALGAALYRAGRFAEAARELGEASTLKPDPMTSPGYAGFFLAMAHQRQGNADEARRSLAKAVQGLDSELATAPWNRRLTFQLLRREAEELVESTKK